jgi:hypothetical protein
MEALGRRLSRGTSFVREVSLDMPATSDADGLRRDDEPAQS